MWYISGMSHDVSLYGFELPTEHVATAPPAQRGDSRLLVVTPSQTVDAMFADSLEWMQPSDVLVMNNTRVMKARLVAHKPTGARIELLLLRDMGVYWQALIKPAKRVRMGDQVIVSDDLTIEIGPRIEHPTHPLYQVRLQTSLPPMVALERWGQLPLPPYMNKQPTEQDDDRYQTCVATQLGSVAAPTAGLHWSDHLLSDLRQKGVSIHTLTLHIGYGTFQPITTHDIRDHVMHEEWVHIPPDTADAVNQAIREGRRVIAVGTTVTRALESAWTHDRVVSGDRYTRVYLYPGSTFRVISGLFTNFHLPYSSLFVLVCAVMGRDRMQSAYAHAIAQGYRFYSYGDATLLLPKG